MWSLRHATFFLALWLLFYCDIAACNADSQDDTAVRVHVVELSDHRAVPKARVFLICGTSSENRATLTDQDGRTSLSDVSSGTCRLVVRKHGFESLTKTLTIEEGLVTDVTVSLVTSLPLIGRVAAKSSADVFTERLGSNNVAASLAPDLLHALDDLNGVSTLFSSNGQFQGAELNGREPTLTNYAFSGTQLSNPVASHLLDPNLLSAVEVNPLSDTLNVIFLNPSIEPEVRYQQTLGGYDYEVERPSISGTVGSVGFAGVAAITHGASALDGSTYLDSSGEIYKHIGQGSSQGYYGAITAPVGDSLIVSAKGLVRHNAILPIPAYFDGKLPYGTGPGTVENDKSGLSWVTVAATLSDAIISADVARSTLASSINEPRPSVVATKPFSLSAIESSLQTNLNADVPSAANARMHLFVDRIKTSSSQSSAPFGPSSSAGQILIADLQTGADLKVGANRLGRVTLAASDSNGLAAGLDFVATLSHRKDHFRFDFGSTTQSNPATSEGTFDSPRAAIYNCASSSATLNGPSQAGAPVHKFGASAAWRHSANGLSTSLYAYDYTYSNVVLNQALVPAAFEPPGFLPDGLIAAIRQGYRSFGRCPSPPPTASNIYILQNLAGLRLLYRGVALELSRQLGTTVLVRGFYDVQPAVLLNQPKAISGPSSIYIVGRQLPFQPLHRAGLTIAWTLGDRHTALAAESLFTSANNPNILPSYVGVTLGLSRVLSQKATLQFAASNVTHSFVDDFSSPRFAAPIPTVGGTSFLTNAAPLGQPNAFIRLNLTL